MNSLEKIDPNFNSEPLDGHELVFLAPEHAGMELSGLPGYPPEREFLRLPRERLAEANEGVRALAWHTSGAVLRFRTDSPVLGLRAELREAAGMAHMPLSGSSGFDLFEGSGPEKVFASNLRTAFGSSAVEGLFRAGLSREMRDWTLYFPLYNGVRECRIGLAPESSIAPPTPMPFEKPVLFYGSSITQGGCASRPGNAYPAILCRRLDAPMINWGFSGSGRGEPGMARAVAERDLAAFVLDYDHNAPTPEHLAATHEPFYTLVREAHPDLPILLPSRPDFYDNEPCRERRDIVRRTFENAVSRGDKNVYFIDGETLFGDRERDLCTVDGCHPNDIGFLRMADGLTPVLRAALFSKRS